MLGRSTSYGARGLTTPRPGVFAGRRPRSLLARAFAPRLAANEDAILLNAELFNRVKSVYDRRTELDLTAEQNYLLERYYLDFVQSGALLSNDSKERLRAINQECATLESDAPRDNRTGRRISVEGEALLRTSSTHTPG